MRKLFADKDVDAVSITTPNHWHALSTIWACQAGKDVYCEKPACYNVHEGERMIDVARKTSRMVQIGSQSRSQAYKIKAIQLLNEGIIGKGIHGQGPLLQAPPLHQTCRRFARPAGRQLGHVPRSRARCVPSTRCRFKYNWHWFWDTGNGDIGNQGVHEMDIARWGLGEVAWPKSVVSTGGKYVYTDDQETPNTQFAPSITATRSCSSKSAASSPAARAVSSKAAATTSAISSYGADGWMKIDGDRIQGFQGRQGRTHHGGEEGFRRRYSAPHGELPGRLPLAQLQVTCMPTSPSAS